MFRYAVVNLRKKLCVTVVAIIAIVVSFIAARVIIKKNPSYIE